MSQQYYGGSSARDAHQRKLNADSFAELVEQYVNVPHNIRMTRAEYHQLSHKKQGLAKDGPFVTACTFKEPEDPTEERDTKRNDANANQLTLVALDLDCPSEADKAAGYVDYAEAFVSAPETLADALHPYNYAAYETASSTEGNRSMRILIDIELSKLNTQKKYVAFAASMLGIVIPRWKGARESRVISQPMYRPVTFAGEGTARVVGSRTSGVQLKESDVPQEVQEEVEREYSYQGVHETEGASLLDLPSNYVEISDVEEALSSMDPDCDYREWTMIACALRHQFRSEEQAEEAYALFDEWSSTGTKYQGEQDTYAKWRSFKPSVRGKRPVTIKSLLKSAKNQGWSPKKVTSKSKEGVLEWIENCDDVDTLIEEGAQHIAAMPFQSSIMEELLTVALRSKINKLANKTLDKGIVKRAIREARKVKAHEDDEDDIPAWLRPWVYVGNTNLFQHKILGLELNQASFDNMFSEKLMTKEGEGESEGSGRPSILPSHYALNVIKIPRVDSTTYDPSYRGEEPFFKFEGIRYLNTFSTRSMPAEDPDTSAEAEDIFRKHLRVLIREDYLADLLWHCIASAFQYPERLIKWMMVIQSGQGAGKSLIGDILSALIGLKNIKIVGPKAMTSDFNEWSVDCAILIFEELYAQGTNSNRLSATNSVKDLITNPTISINQKYRDMRVSMNRSLKLGFTNYADSLALDESDRRILPVISPIQTRTHASVYVKSGHFDQLARCKDELSGGLLHALMVTKIPSDFPYNGPAPHSPYREQLIHESKNKLQVEIEDLIEESTEPLIADDIIHTKALMSTLSLENTRNNHQPSHFLHRMNYERYEGGKKFSINGVSTTIWVHRENYDEDFGRADEILRELGE